MSTRPAIVAIVRQCAFDALTSQRIPDNATPFEEAEGLIAHAIAKLSEAVGGDAALYAHKMVDQHILNSASV